MAHTERGPTGPGDPELKGTGLPGVPPPPAEPPPPASQPPPSQPPPSLPPLSFPPLPDDPVLLQQELIALRERLTDKERAFVHLSRQLEDVVAQRTAQLRESEER